MSGKKTLYVSSFVKNLAVFVIILSILCSTANTFAFAEEKSELRFRGIPFGIDAISFCDEFNATSDEFKISVDEVKDGKSLLYYYLMTDIKDAEFKVAGYQLSKLSVYFSYNNADDNAIERTKFYRATYTITETDKYSATTGESDLRDKLSALYGDSKKGKDAQSSYYYWDDFSNNAIVKLRSLYTPASKEASYFISYEDVDLHNYLLAIKNPDATIANGKDVSGL